MCLLLPEQRCHTGLIGVCSSGSGSVFLERFISLPNATSQTTAPQEDTACYLFHFQIFIYLFVKSYKANARGYQRKSFGRCIETIPKLVE